MWFLSTWFDMCLIKKFNDKMVFYFFMKTRVLVIRWLIIWFHQKKTHRHYSYEKLRLWNLQTWKFLPHKIVWEEMTNKYHLNFTWTKKGLPFFTRTHKDLSPIWDKWSFRQMTKCLSILLWSFIVSIHCCHRIVVIASC